MFFSKIENSLPRKIIIFGPEFLVYFAGNIPVGSGLYICIYIYIRAGFFLRSKILFTYEIRILAESKVGPEVDEFLTVFCDFGTVEKP